jgi:glutamate racemase
MGNMLISTIEVFKKISDLHSNVTNRKLKNLSEKSSDKTENRKSKIRNLPIGIFDSGVGGLTVYRALHERLPMERFVYLGDTARVPYGTKSLATVERYAIENSQFLVSRGIKILVVACNTASALALPKIKEKIGIEVVGVIGPGARDARRNHERKRRNRKSA